MLRIHTLALLLLVGGASLAQERFAKGIPAPEKASTFESRVLDTWDEDKRPEVLQSGTAEVPVDLMSTAMLSTLNPVEKAPEVAAGASEFVILKFPNGVLLHVERVRFSSEADAQAYACYGVPADKPVFVEVRGPEVVSLHGDALGGAKATGVAKLRSAAWSRAKAGLGVAANWSLITSATGDGGFAFVTRGPGVMHDQLVATREKAREKSTDLERSMQLAWLDGERETLSMVLTSNNLPVELHSGARQGSFVMHSDAAHAEGLKGFIRQVLQRSLPAAPADVEAAKWIGMHRKAKIGGNSPHTTPVLLTTHSRPATTAAAEEPVQEGTGGLTEGVEQGTAPSK